MLTLVRSSRPPERGFLGGSPRPRSNTVAHSTDRRRTTTYPRRVVRIPQNSNSKTSITPTAAAVVDAEGGHQSSCSLGPVLHAEVGCRRFNAHTECADVNDARAREKYDRGTLRGFTQAGSGDCCAGRTPLSARETHVDQRIRIWRSVGLFNLKAFGV